MKSLPLVSLVILAISVAPAIAQLPSNDSRKSGPHRGDVLEAIDVFDAIDQQLVAVRYIAVSSSRGNLIAENLTDQEIIVRLPDAIAARPVLAQAADPFGANGLANNNNGGGGGQSVGGNANGGQQGIGQQGFGQPGIGQQGVGFQAGGQAFQNGGLMRIGPAKTRKRTVVTVCLQYGKPDPVPAMKYELVRFESLDTDPLIERLCRELGGPDLTTSAGQAAAWHLIDSIAWTELETLNRLESKYLGNVRRFSNTDITHAKNWTDASHSVANPQDQYSHAASPSETIQ